MQMEGVRVFSPDEWEGSGADAPSYAAMDLKKCLEGLARHLFGILEVIAFLFFISKWKMEDASYRHTMLIPILEPIIWCPMSNVHKCAGAVEMRWVGTYFPFTNPSFELEIYLIK